MKWVKASERLPENRKWKSLKLSTPNYSGSNYDGGWFNPDGYFVTISGHRKIDEIEWLDESDTESELREQVRKLREGLGEIAGYGTFLTVEDAYEMNELAKQLLKGYTAERDK